MFPSVIRPLFPVHPAMLLVLLPTVGPAAGQETPPARASTTLLLKALQAQLGVAIRVLTVDEASHPSVVHAFDGRGVPAFVLLRNGVELWRQQGLPEGAPMAALLLSKLQEATPSAPK
jgi:hypothetical protein